MKPTLILLICALLPGLVAAQKQNPEVLLEKGWKEYEQGNYASALTWFNECLRQFPSFNDAYYARAVTKERTNDLPGALTDYSIFLETTPEHYEAVLGRAGVRYKLNKFEEAKSDYLKVLTLDPGETNTVMFRTNAQAGGNLPITTAQSDLRPVIFNHIGLAEVKLKNFKAALHWFDSAIARQPNEADYFANRGTAWENIDPAKAKLDYEKALRLRPDHSAALVNLSALKSRNGTKASDTEEDYLEKAIESDSTMLHPYLERAYQRLQGGYFKGALDDYNRAIELEKNDPDIWLNRGLTKEKLHDYKGAFADYTQAITLKEDYGKAWLNRGNVLMRLNRFTEAVEDYSVAITYQPDYGPAFYNRAIAKEKLKQFQGACEDANKAEALDVAIDPKFKSKVCR